MSPALHDVGGLRGGAGSTVRQVEQPVRVLMRGLDSWLPGNQPQSLGVSEAKGPGRVEGARVGTERGEQGLFTA